jgi:CheY-like chemotaxis protein
MRPPTSQSSSTASQHVLIADDDPVVRHLLRRVLTKEFNCTVDEAADGAEALRAIASTSYCLVFLDLRMPLVDGLQALGYIRSRPETSKVPVIVLSASCADDVVRHAVQMGVADFLMKPLSPSVAERLKRVLSRDAA